MHEDLDEADADEEEMFRRAITLSMEDHYLQSKVEEAGNSE